MAWNALFGIKKLNLTWFLFSIYDAIYTAFLSFLTWPNFGLILFHKLAYRGYAEHYQIPKMEIFVQIVCFSVGRWSIITISFKDNLDVGGMEMHNYESL